MAPEASGERRMRRPRTEHPASGAVALPPPVSVPRRWFMLELEVGLLVALWAGVYVSRLTDLPIRGDESNWAIVAQEMVRTGDFIVPRRQGEPFPDRPPLNSWLIATLHVATGAWNAAIVRLPSILALLATILGIYGFARGFLGRVGALAAAAAYGTMGHVLQHGRLAETDDIFVACVSGSLFVWCSGYVRGWPAARTWMAGYALAALAALAKGPQGPVYFVGPVGMFLLLRRDWRFLLSTSHLAGLATFAAMLGAWQVPFFMELGWPGVRHVWSEEGHLATRFDYSNLSLVLSRWAQYPIKVLACMLPWSVMLLVALSRWWRGAIGPARPYATFLVVALATTFPTVWLAADAMPRYFMSMYPCVACFVGLVIDVCWQSAGSTFWQRSWSRFVAWAAAAAAMTSVAVVVIPWVPLGKYASDLALSGTATAVLSGGLLAVAAAMFWALRGRELWRGRISVLAPATGMGLVMTIVVLNVAIRHSTQPAEEMARIRAHLPSDASLVSLGPVHHRFAYYFQDPIKLVPLPTAATPLDPSVEYFCVTVYEGPTPDLPFEWVPLGEVSCDRSPRLEYPNRVIVGRRLGADRAAARKQGPENTSRR